MKTVALWMSLATGLAGCIAPEPPPPVRRAAPAPRPEASSATFEDAPLPNRKMGAPSADSVIRMAH